MRFVFVVLMLVGCAGQTPTVADASKVVTEGALALTALDDVYSYVCKDPSLIPEHECKRFRDAYNALRSVEVVADQVVP